MVKWLANRVAIVTGSGQGIGRAIALTLSKEGAHVITNSRKPGTPGGDAEITANEIRLSGGQAFAFFGDVSKWESCQELAKFAISKFGDIDILVTNAGITIDELFINTSKEDFDLMIDINLKGQFNCLQAVLPHMISKKYGRIITISSGASLGTTQGEVAYGATKAAVVCMTQGLALEVKDYGVTVNTLMPVAKTRLSLHSVSKMGVGVTKLTTGLGINQTPESNAPIVAFLAGERTGKITGRIFTRRFEGTIQVLNNGSARGIYKEGIWTVNEIEKVVGQLLPDLL